MCELKEYSLKFNRDQYETVMDALKRYAGVDADARNAMLIVRDAMHAARSNERANMKTAISGTTARKIVDMSQKVL